MLRRYFESGRQRKCSKFEIKDNEIIHVIIEHHLRANQNGNVYGNKGICLIPPPWGSTPVRKTVTFFYQWITLSQLFFFVFGPIRRDKIN